MPIKEESRRLISGSQDMKKQNNALVTKRQKSTVGRIAKASGPKSQQDFVNAMYAGERTHLDAALTEGFANVLLHGQTSDDEDNSFDRELEPEEYFNYHAGALVAEVCILGREVRK
jgi:hypothetical protein